MKKSSIDHYTYAYLSNEVYKEGGGRPPSNWEIYDAYYPFGAKGLGVCAYINHNNKAIIISIRGSNNDEDWNNNYGFALFNLEPDNVRYVHDFIRNTRENVKLKIESEKKEKKIHLATALFEDMALVAEKTVMAYEQFEISLTHGQYPNIITIYQRYLAKYAEAAISLLFRHYFHRLFRSGFSYFLDLVIADESTRNQILIDSGINDEATTRFFSEELNKIQSNFKIELNEIKKTLADFESQHPDYQVSLTGHSAGALIAEVCASELSIPAVTFESPGSSTIACKVRNFNETLANQMITGYLSAPNIINTAATHMGTGYRLYIPHIDSDMKESTEYKITYFTKSLIDTTKRIATPLLVFNPFAASVTIAGTLATKGILYLWESKEWHVRQHNMTNILNCFDEKSGSPHKVSRIISWPSIYDQMQSRAVGFFTDFIPFKSDNYGLHTYFFSDEDNIIESMIDNLYQYEVSHIEKIQSSVEPADERPLARTAGSERLIVIDRTLIGADQLKAAAKTEVVTYDSSRTSLGELLNLIKSRSKAGSLTSIGFAAHGDDKANLHLTSNSMCGSLNPDQRAFWEAIGTLLQSKGQIHLFSCSLGASQQGQALLQQIHEASGKTVAGSDDLTGFVEQGDWLLESIHSHDDSVPPVDAKALYFEETLLQEYKAVMSSSGVLSLSQDETFNTSHPAQFLKDTWSPEAVPHFFDALNGNLMLATLMGRVGSNLWRSFRQSLGQGKEPIESLPQGNQSAENSSPRTGLWNKTVNSTDYMATSACHFFRSNGIEDHLMVMNPHAVKALTEPVATLEAYKK